MVPCLLIHLSLFLGLGFLGIIFRRRLGNFGGFSLRLVLFLRSDCSINRSRDLLLRNGSSVLHPLGLVLLPLGDIVDSMRNIFGIRDSMRSRLCRTLREKVWRHPGQIWLRTRRLLLLRSALCSFRFRKLILSKSSLKSNSSGEFSFFPEHLDATFDEGLWPIHFFSTVPDVGLVVLDVQFRNLVELNRWRLHASNSLRFFALKLLGCLWLTRLLELLNGFFDLCFCRNQRISFFGGLWLSILDLLFLALRG